MAGSSSFNALPRISPSPVQATSSIAKTTMNAGRDITMTNIGHNVVYNAQASSSVLKELYQALQPVDSAIYDSKVSEVEQCFQGTRIQLLNEIWSWIEGKGSSAPVYVLDGVAGIGKSTVAQTIAHQAAEKKMLGATFHFSRDEQARQTTHRFAPTIAYQLAVHKKKFAEELTAALQQYPDIHKKTLRQQLATLIFNPLQKLLTLNPLERLWSSKKRPLLIVIDGLDECNAKEAKSLLECIAVDFQVVAQLKVFITTRPEFHLRQILDHHGHHERFHLHEIEDSIVQADIRLYLESQLSADAIKKQLPGINVSWTPNPAEMKMLCGICGNLFITASTAIKFILDDQRLDPKRQLSRLLDGVSPEDFTGSSRTDAMDKFYMHILLSALPDHHDVNNQKASQDWLDGYRAVLGTILTVQNPLPCHSLAEVLNVDTDFVDRTLIRLHSLIAPKGLDRVYRIHHKTFPDFISNEDRITRAFRSLAPPVKYTPTSFLINLSANHLRLAKKCFRVMGGELKKNMCHLHPHDMYNDDKEVQQNLMSTRARSKLAYACTQWAHHLRTASRLEGVDNELKEYVDIWRSSQILAWLEALSILGKIDNVDDILEHASKAIAQAVTTHWSKRDMTLEVLSDARKFVQQNSSILELASMHTYWSLLPFIPTKTRLYETYNCAGNGLRLVLGAEQVWGYEIAVLKKHNKPVNSVVFSRDGSRLASASNDKTILLWDGNTGRHIATLDRHSAPVLSVAFSSDASKLASAAADDTLWLWNANTGHHLTTLSGRSATVDSWMFCNAFVCRLAPDVAWGELLGVPSWEEATALKGRSLASWSVGFTSDGLWLASASISNVVLLWNIADTANWIATLEGHSNRVLDVAFSGDGLRLASASSDKTIRLWNGSTGAHIATLKGHSARVNTVAFSSDGSRLASGSGDKTVRVWDGFTGTHIATLEGHSGWVKSVSVSNDGSKIASASSDRKIWLWDGLSGAKIGTFKGHLSTVRSVALSRDGLRLASASNDETVRLWDGTTAANIAPVKRHSRTVTCVAFSADGSRLASASSDQTVQLWDGNTGYRIASLEGHSDWITAITFSRNGSRLASASWDHTILLWDGITGTLIATLFHPDSVKSVAFSRDGSRLASASLDGTVGLWNGNTGDHIATLEGHSSMVRSVTFSCDGSMLASASSDKTVRLWNGLTGAHAGTLQYGNRDGTALEATSDINL